MCFYDNDSKDKKPADPKYINVVVFHKITKTRNEVS